jgi:hypothetical protein
MAVSRGLAVVFDVGPEHCGAAEVAIEDGAGELQMRYVHRPVPCERPVAAVWLGRVGLCEEHCLQLWPQLAETP